MIDKPRTGAVWFQSRRWAQAALAAALVAADATTRPRHRLAVGRNRGGNDRRDSFPYQMSTNPAESAPPNTGAPLSAAITPERTTMTTNTSTCRTLRAVAAAVIAVAMLTLPTTAAADEGFADVSDSNPHSANIHTLDHAGTYEGTECGRRMFCPSAPLSRAHMAVWLVRVLDGSDPDPVTATRFSDVAGAHPQAAFIERFAHLGVTEGCTTEPLRYCPDQHVTRSQMASFLARAFNLAAAGESAGFADVAAGGTHSANIDTLAASGITHGCDTEPLRYCPRDDVSRAQMASFLVRADAYVQAATDPEEPPADEWVAPYAGYVPEVHPDTPPPEWVRGDYKPGRLPIETPRITGEDRVVVAQWLEWIGQGGYTQWLLLQMKSPLDYLGAHPNCIVNEYNARVDALNALNLPRGQAEPNRLVNDHGWHNCATVIDPYRPGIELPADRPNDVGLRLSDTPGITLAERCRAVLPDDITLQTYHGWQDERGKWVGEWRDHFGHAGCDAWAEWITTGYDYGRYPQCQESVYLAEEWMEHHLGQPKDYGRGLC